jgi:hypothetical protein
LEEVIGKEGLSDTQIRIFNALSPIWKCMVMERFYKEINWIKSNGLVDILKPDGNLVIYNKGGDSETLQVENWDNNEKKEAEKVIQKNLQEMNEKKKDINGNKKNKERLRKDRIQLTLKRQYEKEAINKFIYRDQTKANKSWKCNEKKKNGPRETINVDTAKIKGYKWSLDQEDKEKEFSNEEIEEVIEWVRNLALNIRNVILTEIIRKLYDKWIVLQKVGSVDTEKMLRIIQDEAINQAYIARDFGTMQRIAEIGRYRICSAFYDVVVCFCYKKVRK